MSATTDMRNSNITRWSVVALLAALGILAISLGLPRLVAGILAGPQNETLRELAAGTAVPATILERTLRSREKALGWLQSGRFYSDLAILRLVAVGHTRVLSPERRHLASEAIALQARALTLAPADAYGWTRLLQGLAVNAASVAQVERILDVALRRAPYEPGLVMVRLRVAMLYWRGLSKGMRTRLARQIRLAALWLPTALAQLARARFLVPEVAEALVANPRLAARFAYALNHG